MSKDLEKAPQNTNENNASDVLPIELSEVDEIGPNADTSKTLNWPVFPNENLNTIARMFYPKSLNMQKRFISKTQQLNPDLQHLLTPETLFVKPELLIVPTLKLLAYNQAANPTSDIQKSKKPVFRISYDLQKTINDQTQSLLNVYDELVSKNLFLKAQLAELYIKISGLETQLDGLKLIFDKSLQLSTGDISPQPKSINKFKAKIFVNNSKILPDHIGAPQAKQQSLFDQYAINLAQILALIGIVFFVNYCLKKYRVNAFEKFVLAMPNTHEASLASKMASQKTELMIKDKQNLLSQDLLVEEAQKQDFKAHRSFDALENMASSLVEAKLLVSINRNQDAIAHLKSIIQNHPKSSINHWLYLLEIFKKIDAKEDFENYAKQLHLTFNVMTPSWHEASVSVYVPQHLEEFAHIIQKLQATWPSTQALTYLHTLIADNREGERVGFGQNVLSEILLLMELLNNR